MEHLPPHLRRKLRDYRFAYWCLAIAETICLGAGLIAFLEPAALLLAVLWLGWKLWRSPTDRLIAAKLESQHPDLREKLVSVVELTRHADGSPDLRHQAFADIDNLVGEVEIAPLLSLRTIAAFMAVAIIANLAVGVQRQRELGGRGSRRAAPLSQTKTNGVAGAMPSKMSLADLATALRSQPESVLTKLPPYARSLDKTEAAARQAAAGIDADANRAQVAESLAEFARLAKEVPALAAIARSAEALAKEFAATRISVTTQAPPDFTNTTGTVSSPPVIVEAALPAATTGPTWQNPDVAGADSASRIPTQYESAVRTYLEKLTANSH